MLSISSVRSISSLSYESERHLYGTFKSTRGERRFMIHKNIFQQMTESTLNKHESDQEEKILNAHTTNVQQKFL